MLERAEQSEMKNEWAEAIAQVRSELAAASNVAVQSAR
jgi:hypothetical protein